jgi:dynein heavy chain 1
MVAQLVPKIQKLIAVLPHDIELLKRTSKSITNPLFRFLEREVTVGATLLHKVRNDLFLLKDMCSGEKKFTQQMKKLAEELNTDVIPSTWRKYNVANITASEWLDDFSKRVE